MKNFYFVLTLNVNHPRIKLYLDQTMLSLGTVDLKTRSKLFNSFNEAIEYAQEDFELKLEYLVDDEEVLPMSFMTVMNPSFALPSVQDQVQERFGVIANVWEEHCAAALFFAEATEDDTDNDEEEIDENSMPTATVWMAKYEVYFVDDAIEFTKNGEYVFNPALASMTSSYH